MRANLGVIMTPGQGNLTYVKIDHTVTTINPVYIAEIDPHRYKIMSPVQQLTRDNTGTLVCAGRTAFAQMLDPIGITCAEDNDTTFIFKLKAHT